MIVAVMTRVEKQASLPHQIRKIALQLWTHVQGRFAVSNHIDHVANRFTRRRYIDRAVMLATDHR